MSSRTEWSSTDNRVALSLFGEKNANLKRIELETGAKLHSRGNELDFLGPTDAHCPAGPPSGGNSSTAWCAAAARWGPRTSRARRMCCAGMPTPTCRKFFPTPSWWAAAPAPSHPRVWPKNDMFDAIRERDIVFGIGPAGTGKTYLAMALALRQLMEKRVKRIVLTRPALEAGERLGFLPGSMEEKVSPTCGRSTMPCTT